MRILFILENFYPYIGGVETLFKNLTEELVKEDIEVTVLTNQFSKELSREEKINGVEVIRLPFKNRYLFTFLAGWSAIKYAKNHNLIHTTSYNAGIPAFIAGLFTGTKTVITFHEVWDKLWFKLPFMNKISLAFHYLFEWFLLKLPFHKFIAVSNYTAASLNGAGIKKKKIVKIYNGIEYDRFERAEIANNPIKEFTYFGRLGISKGLDILLDAIEILVKEKMAFRFNLIIPTLPSGFHQTIRSIIKEKQIDQNISIFSDLSVEDLFSKVANSDAVVVPSYSEGFCFTAVETMALGVPIISSDMGALKEVISGQHLKMSSYSAEALADAMQLALEDKWITTPLKKFPLSDSIQNYIDFYKSISEEDV